MKKELSLYIHIPFCVRKCAYCDFLSFAATAETRELYLQALSKEIKDFSFTVADKKVVSIFIGGGTPSILEGRQIGQIMDTIFQYYQVVPGAEITIEVNPGTVTLDKLKLYRKSGINRISFGLQSSKEEELQLLGRIHTYEQFEDNYILVRNLGFQNISVDLMSALPGQTLDSWKETLQKVVALHPDHVSAYSLIIEEGTPFYELYHEENERRMQGEATNLLPDEETERAICAWTKEYLEDNGYRQYEISNYGKTGKESLHNIGYWIRREYAGFGLGAASLLNNIRYINTSSMEEYLERGREVQHLQKLSKAECMEEQMYLGLRMTCGVSKKRFLENFGQEINDVYKRIIKDLKEKQLLDEDDEYVWLTAYGMDISNYCMAQFLLD